MQRRPVTQVSDADFARQFDVPLPEYIMPRLMHFVAAPLALLNRRIAALESRGEDETCILRAAPSIARGARCAEPYLRWPVGPVAHRTRVDRSHDQPEDSMAGQQSRDFHGGKTWQQHVERQPNLIGAQ